MKTSSVIQSVLTELVMSDPAGNSFRPGFDIDIRGYIPQTVKDVLHSCIMTREYSPVSGILIRSAKPIFPVYQGTTTNGYIHFKFPGDLVIKVTDILVVRRIDIRLTDLMMKVDISEMQLIIPTWPDVTVKL